MSSRPTIRGEETSSGEPLDAQLARMEGDHDSIESERNVATMERTTAASSTPI